MHTYIEGVSERSELTPCNNYMYRLVGNNFAVKICLYVINTELVSLY